MIPYPATSCKCVFLAERWNGGMEEFLLFPVRSHNSPIPAAPSASRHLCVSQPIPHSTLSTLLHGQSSNPNPVNPVNPVKKATPPLYTFYSAKPLTHPLPLHNLHGQSSNPNPVNPVNPVKKATPPLYTFYSFYTAKSLTHPLTTSH